VAPAEVRRHDIVAQVHSRGRVPFRHQRSRLRQLLAGNDAVDDLASANRADQRSELHVETDQPDFLRRLKRNLKTRAVFRQTASHRGIKHIEKNAREHRHIESALFLIEKAPLRRRFGSADPADQTATAALQKRRTTLAGELKVVAPTVVEIDRRHIDRPLVRHMCEGDRRSPLLATLSWMKVTASRWDILAFRWVLFSMTMFRDVPRGLHGINRHVIFPSSSLC
jgi:hypothetical protein